MEAVLKEIAGGSEDGVKSTLKAFIDLNAASFALDEPMAVVQDFLVMVLSELNKGSWCPPTVAMALHALRIVSRQRSFSEKLTESSSMALMVKLAGLAVGEDDMEALMRSSSEEDISVMVEAVKCLCNLVLNNNHLTKRVSDLRALHALKARLSLSYSASSRTLLPHDVLFFDLRLIFLITACDPNERVAFRDEVGSLPVLVNALDAALFPATPIDVHKSTGNDSSSKPQATTTCADSTPSAESAEVSASSSSSSSTQDCAAAIGEGVAVPTAEGGVADEDMVKSKCVRTLSPFPVRDMCFVLPVPLTEEKCTVASEILKIIFNQTVNWKNEDNLKDEELELFVSLSHLLRLLIISVPPSISKPYNDIFNRTCEVVMNIPFQCSNHFLIPSSHVITPALLRLHPTYCDSQALLRSDLDQVSGEWNYSVAVILLNVLNQRTHTDPQQVDKTGLTAILGACSLLCRASRYFRKFFKSMVLPTVKEVRASPDQEDTLKGRLVRLMTAGLHDCMDVVAEFIFILCKENPNRLVKHTGYGNAAGILMNRGLLYGGRSKGQEDYSSDSGSSETEEIPANVDPVTGGPIREVQNPFEGMSPEEVEAEAEKLGVLIDKLNRAGVMKVMPVDRDNKPVNVPSIDQESQSKEDCSSDES